MDYIGIIIEESLTDSKIIDELKVISKVEEKVTKEHNTPWLQKWTMYTVSIPQDKITEYTERLSKLIDTSKCNDWFTDFKNYEYHYIVFNNKVFKLNVNKIEDYVELEKYATSLGLPKNQMPNYIDAQNELISRFLISAKKNTYANSNAEKMSSSRQGSNDYSYTEQHGDSVLTYHDTYFGGTKFMGEEVVYFSSTVPKWGMNYYGVTVDKSLSEEAMDMVLRPALMMVGEDENVLPVRGPSKFENGQYTYTFKSFGTLDNFNGKEEIYKGNKLIFELNCHGGFIE